jgi:hypothetical protein
VIVGVSDGSKLREPESDGLPTDRLSVGAVGDALMVGSVSDALCDTERLHVRDSDAVCVAEGDRCVKECVAEKELLRDGDGVDETLRVNVAERDSDTEIDGEITSEKESDGSEKLREAVRSSDGELVRDKVLVLVPAAAAYSAQSATVTLRRIIHLAPPVPVEATGAFVGARGMTQEASEWNPGRGATYKYNWAHEYKRSTRLPEVHVR